MDNENNNFEDFEDFDEIVYKRKFDLLEKIQDYIEEGFIPTENIGMNSNIVTLEFELTILKKKHVLSQLNKLKEMGILLSKEYTIDDNYQEMIYELKYRKMLINNKKTAKVLKEIIPTIGTLIEMGSKMLGLDNINGKKIDLTGFGDHIKERVLIGDYDKSINKVAKIMSKHDDIIEKDPGFMLLKEVITDFHSVVFINSIKKNENKQDDDNNINYSDSIDDKSDNVSLDSFNYAEKFKKQKEDNIDNNSINSNNDDSNINNIFNELIVNKTNKFNETMTFDEAKKVFSKTFNKNLEELSIDNDIDLTIIEENERIDKMMKL
jgi:hypothetical protein